MNPNYNLMRLANLYGGMNKFATPSPEVATYIADAAKAKEEAERAAAAAAAANNAGKAQNAANIGALLSAGVTPQEAMRIAAGKGKTSPVTFNKIKNDGTVAEYDSLMGTPGAYWDKAVNWAKENPWLAGGIGAGALGLGGLGAYYAMKDDEEEERKKSASFIDPYVAQVLAQDYLTKMAAANGVPSVAAGVTGLGNYTKMF